MTIIVWAVVPSELGHCWYACGSDEECAMRQRRRVHRGIECPDGSALGLRFRLLLMGRPVDKAEVGALCIIVHEAHHVAMGARVEEEHVVAGSTLLREGLVVEAHYHRLVLQGCEFCITQQPANRLHHHVTLLNGLRAADRKTTGRTGVEGAQ